jgi:formylglycine-generating enzyme required for sulfatase activity
MPHRPTVLFYLLAALLLLAPTPFARAAHHPKPLAAGTTRINPKDRALMVYVPAGPFLMGDVDLATIEVTFPRHTVTLDAFWIYKNDVTVAQYRKFCQATGWPMP